MITNSGKEIIAKYMLGQAPAYATHISLGCGSLPRKAKFVITNKDLTSNVVTLTTSIDHSFIIGDSVVISGVDSVFNGTYTVTAVGSSVTFSYALTHANVTSVASAGTAVLNFFDKQTMDFEMLRLPISSKGFVNENGVAKIALSAEMPTEERYEISEVALWSAGANTNAVNSDSRTLFSFADTEGWQEHTASSTGPIYSQFTHLNPNTSSFDFVIQTTPKTVTNKALTSNVATLTTSTAHGYIVGDYVTVTGVDATFNGSFYITAVGSTVTFSYAKTATNVTSTSATGSTVIDRRIIATNAANSVIMSSNRKTRQEGSRYLSNTYLIRGDTADIDGAFVVNGSYANRHIHLDGKNINLVQNNPNDQIKIALSIMPRVESNTTIPASTRIVIEFLQSEATPTVGYARLTHDILRADMPQNNHYYVITKQLKDLETSDGFSWADVKVTRVYISVYKELADTLPSNEYFIALDAVRFENITSINPLYAMSGYSLVDNALGQPIYKIANTSNYIEFRMSVGVG